MMARGISIGVAALNKSGRWFPRNPGNPLTKNRKLANLSVSLLADKGVQVLGIVVSRYHGVKVSVRPFWRSAGKCEQGSLDYLVLMVIGEGRRLLGEVSVLLPPRWR